MSNNITEQPDGTINVMDENGNLVRKIRKHLNLSDINQMGYFGNVWVRSHYYAKAGDTNGGGHKHNFDHVTLLAVGSVLVEVEGQTPKTFDAPTFIVIDKDHNHKFTALTDGVVYYCVFALRDLDGSVVEMYDASNSPMDHTPFEARIADDDLTKLRAES
jgi:hypothetical protein